jgi:2-polyprenyl-3-methyl-5-hydroxy-6-metoxy-1,4-benzoquinol methylase
VELFFNHFGRYYHAMKRLAISDQDVVIDASCGCGYGSVGLAKRACLVYGIDVNEAYLQIAQETMGTKNIIFLTYDDFYKITHPAIADKVVCIETLEHIPQGQNEQFLERLIGTLKDSGSMFLTTPLGNNRPSEYNPFHCFEPSIDVLHVMLSRYFGSIDMEVDTFTNSFGFLCKFASVLLRNKR